MARFMIEPYSLDLRKRAVALLDEGASSLEVAEMLGVSDSWVRKMRLRRDELGHLLPGQPPGKERILTEAHDERAVPLGLRPAGRDAGGVGRADGQAPEGAREHLDAVASAHRAGADAQKKTLHATEAERPEIQQERERFLRRSIIRRAPRLLFIDETGINLSMTRTYARAPAGMRAVDAVPKNWGDNVTVTAALTLDGIVAPMMLHGAMDTLAFEALRRAMPGARTAPRRRGRPRQAQRPQDRPGTRTGRGHEPAWSTCPATRRTSTPSSMPGRS